jgi:hypothetical protein
MKSEEFATAVPGRFLILSLDRRTKEPYKMKSEE